MLCACQLSHRGGQPEPQDTGSMTLDARLANDAGSTDGASATDAWSSDVGEDPEDGRVLMPREPEFIGGSTEGRLLSIYGTNGDDVELLHQIDVGENIRAHRLEPAPSGDHLRLLVWFESRPPDCPRHFWVRHSTGDVVGLDVACTAITRFTWTSDGGLFSGASGDLEYRSPDGSTYSVEECSWVAALPSDGSALLECEGGYFRWFGPGRLEEVTLPEGFFLSQWDDGNDTLIAVRELAEAEFEMRRFWPGGRSEWLWTWEQPPGFVAVPPEVVGGWLVHRRIMDSERNCRTDFIVEGRIVNTENQPCTSSGRLPLALSPDERHVALSSRVGWQVFARPGLAIGGEDTGVLRGYSPDGRRIMELEDEEGARIYDSATLERVPSPGLDALREVAENVDWRQRPWCNGRCERF